MVSKIKQNRGIESLFLILIRIFIAASKPDSVSKRKVRRCSSTGNPTHRYFNFSDFSENLLKIPGPRLRIRLILPILTLAESLLIMNLRFNL